MTIQPISDPSEGSGNDGQIQPPAPAGDSRRSLATVLDLVLFGFFFVASLVIIPAGIFQLMRVFNPGLRFTDLSAVEQILIQGILNLTLVGFIYVLVKVLHGEPFLQFIHWYRTSTYRIGFLFAFGVSLAMAVLVVSSFFPPSEPPPIERLLSTPGALWVFALFGVGVAPLFEEIIFRGFLFRVIGDLAGPGAAVPGTAALFALLHIPQLWGSWAGIGLIFFVGYVLSKVREQANSLIPSFIMHTAYNATLFTLFAVSSVVQKTAN